MKLFLTALTAVTILCIGCAERDSPQKIVARIKQNYEQHASVAYRIYYRTKYSGDEDTVSLNATCQLVRDTVDKLFGGCVWMLVNDTFETYYNRSRMYSLNHGTKKIIDCDGNEENSHFIHGTTAGEVMNIKFMRPARLFKEVSDTTNKVTLESTGNYFIIHVKQPDQEDLSDIESSYWIKKDDFVIDKIISKLKFQGSYQYSEWNLSDIVFDKVAVAELDKSMEVYKTSYTPEPYPPAEVPILKAGTMAPFFTGTDVQTGKEISLKDYKGQFAILDFSYMSCYPCIMIIPHLNNIQKEYKDKNVAVLAINSKDTEEQYRKKLPDFMTRNAMAYPVILTSSKTDSAYQVTGYPTLYVIDKMGKIIYSELGFGEGLEDSLRIVLNGRK